MWWFSIVCTPKYKNRWHNQVINLCTSYNENFLKIPLDAIAAERNGYFQNQEEETEIEYGLETRSSNQG